MGDAITQHHALDDQTMLLLVGGGDTSRLTPQQKLAYYNARCEAAGLDPRAQPFEFMKLGPKEQLYARKAATDQLASKHGIKVEILSQASDHDIRVVTVRAVAKDGRQTDEIGAVPIKGLSGELLANALMKAVTKAKRRAILSLCGLGMMDETEVESIAAVQPAPEPASVAARIMALAEPDATARAAEAIVQEVEAKAPADVEPPLRVPPKLNPLFLEVLRQANPLGPNGTHTIQQERYALTFITDRAAAINLPADPEKWTDGMIKTLQRSVFPPSHRREP